MKRRTLYVTVVDAARGDPEFPPEPLQQFVDWLNEQIAKIPEAYRRSATVEIKSESDGYDYYCGAIEISYTRPQTDAEAKLEQATERAEATARAIAQENHERQLLAALTAKYGK